MGQNHPSTAAERAQWAATLLAHQGDYGIVTQLSREHNVSRPTLYAWREQAACGLQAIFSPASSPLVATPTARHILTLWQNHASERGGQAAIRELLNQGLSLATITSVLRQAEQRALDWMQTHLPTSTRALALDEIYGNQRRGAYLTVVDVHSGAVWASEGPLPVDTESWTLVLWSLQDRGLQWDRVVMDDAPAMQAACGQATPAVSVQADQWHLWHVCGQVQARLEREVTQLESHTAVVARQAARVAAGKAPRGPRPKTDATAHALALADARRTATALSYLTQELRRLLDVVVESRECLLRAWQRQQGLQAVLDLLDEVARASPQGQQVALQRLAKRVRSQLPKLLAFVPAVEQVQQELEAVLPPERQALVAWAWLRREVGEWTREELLAWVPLEWRDAGGVLLAAWDDAVRVSSAVERWHSILRPHLAVRRTLSTGMLALLAVWHNHRVFPRGVHKGYSPLHLSGMKDAPTDWLVALGYPPTEAVTPQAASLALAA